MRPPDALSMHLRKIELAEIHRFGDGRLVFHAIDRIGNTFESGEAPDIPGSQIDYDFALRLRPAVRPAEEGGARLDVEVGRLARSLGAHARGGGQRTKGNDAQEDRDHSEGYVGIDGGSHRTSPIEERGVCARFGSVVSPVNAGMATRRPHSRKLRHNLPMRCFPY